MYTMKVLLAVLAIGICGVLVQAEHKKCNKWRKRMKKCEADGYIRKDCREAGDDVVQSKACKKLDKKVRKKCMMNCPTEQPPAVPDTCWDGLQDGYRGDISVTSSGVECMNWLSQEPHGHSRTEANYPNKGLGDHNNCRNPDSEEGGAWCYTTDSNQRWDYCAVPRCLDEEDYCFDGLQKEYRGPKQTTASGKPCQKWTSQSPQEHNRTPENYPDTGLGDHNYCRNPDNEPSGAWCYTTDSASRWEYCGVRKC